MTDTRTIPPSQDGPVALIPAESPCWRPGAHGQPVCVREIGTMPCAECPTPTVRTGGPPADEWRERRSREREQQIRANAADVAAYLIGDTAGTPAGIAARLVELAEPIAAWIATGTVPAERSEQQW